MFALLCLQMLLHPQEEMPLMKDFGFSVAPGTHTQASISMKRVSQRQSERERERLIEAERKRELVRERERELVCVCERERELV